MKTAQQIFNTIVAHFLFQRVPARDGRNDACKYRVPVLDLPVELRRLLPPEIGRNDILKCAAGAVIPDSQYRPEFEGKAVLALLTDKKIMISDPENIGVRQILVELQWIHDTQPEGLINRDTSEKLKDVAERYGLDSSVVVW